MRRSNRRLSVFLLALGGSSGLITLLAALIRVPLAYLAPVYMFTPLAAAFITTYRYDISLSNVGVSGNLNRWFLLAWVLPVLIVFSTLVVSLLVPGVRPNSALSGASILRVGGLSIPPLVSLFVIGVIAGPTINTVFAVGEEIGWRGILLYELRDLGFWRASGVIGFVWGFWHAPLVLQGHNYPEHPVIGVGMMIVFTTLLTPLLIYIRMKAKSVFAAAVFHGTVNAIAALSVVTVSGGGDLIIGITGVSGFIVLAGINVVLWWVMATREPLSIKQMSV